MALFLGPLRKVERGLFLLREERSLFPSRLLLRFFFFLFSFLLPETAQPFGQHGRASQIISNGAAAVAREHHHVLGAVRRCRRAPRVQGRPAGGAEAARAQVLVARHRLAATWKKKHIRNESITVWSALRRISCRNRHICEEESRHAVKGGLMIYVIRLRQLAPSVLRIKLSIGYCIPSSICLILHEDEAWIASRKCTAAQKARDFGIHLGCKGS